MPFRGSSCTLLCSHVKFHGSGASFGAELDGYKFFQEIEGMMNVEDLQKIIEATVKSLMAAQVPTGGKGGGRMGSLDERYFRRVDKLAAGNWKEFHFQFMTAVGAANDKIRGILDDIARAGKEPDWTEIFDGFDQEDITKYSGEVYAALSGLVTGEAMTIVKGVTTGDGFLVWSKMVGRYDPKTPAKALMAMMGVMQPKKVKDVRELPAAIEEWEVKVKTLKLEHNTEIQEQVKVALLTSMLPSDYQDYVFQHAGAAKYDEIRDRVIAVAVNRASLHKPKPMEVDWVRGYDDWGEEQWDTENQDEETAEVDHVGELCRRCSGMGHYARECPTPKGKGKGKGAQKGGWRNSDYGKGKGVDYGKGKGKGASKGGGKGPFAGQCWQCGQPGHRAAECKQNKEADNGQRMQVDAVEGVRYEVGGIWEIAHVTAEEHQSNKWETVKSRKGIAKQKPVPRGVTLGDYLKPRIATVENRFSALSVTDEEYEPKYVHTTSSNFIGTVGAASRGRWRKTGSGEITVDSAAEESVCPKVWEEQYKMHKPARWMKFVNASGGIMNHYGEKTATFRTGTEGNIMSLGFQVSDVKKPLAAVWRTAEKGNKVQFGPAEEDNFIVNVATGNKVMMKRRGGSYVIPADFVVEEPGFHRPV